MPRRGSPSGRDARGALGNSTRSRRVPESPWRGHRVHVARAAIHGKGAERVRIHACQRARTARAWPCSRRACAPSRRSRTGRGNCGGWPPAAAAAARRCSRPVRWMRKYTERRGSETRAPASTRTVDAAPERMLTERVESVRGASRSATAFPWRVGIGIHPLKLHTSSTPPGLRRYSWFVRSSSAGTAPVL